MEYYELPCRVMGLHDLILRAIEIPGGKSATGAARQAAAPRQLSRREEGREHGAVDRIRQRTALRGLPSWSWCWVWPGTCVLQIHALVVSKGRRLQQVPWRRIAARCR